jgi:transcriptional regulator GlxA family with amidase domain
MGTRHVIGLLVTDQMPIFELAVPCEVFGVDRSDIVAPWYDLRLHAGEPGQLRTTTGLIIDAPYHRSELVDADTILVPACHRGVQTDPPPVLLELLREAHARGRRIASICTGAYLLAAAGLLDGRRATTHWMNAVDFAYRFPKVEVDPDVIYVDDGDILSSAGTGAAIDLCLHIVRRDHGAAVANEIARRMVVPPHREGGQAQFAQPVIHVRPEAHLGPVLDWARQRLDRPLTVAHLAGEARMSPRTFARRFRESVGSTPLRWLVQERVRLAQELLETTDEPIERIARRTGFGTAANFRLHFGRITSVSPQTYRHVFRERAKKQGSSPMRVG